MEWLVVLKQRLGGSSSNEVLENLLYAEREHKTAVFRRMHGHQLVFALEWYWLASSEDRTAIRQACRESASAYGALVSGHGLDGDDSDQAVEHVLGVPAKHQKLRRCISAAALLSQVYDTALIVLRLDDTQYWLLALSRGTPIVGKDLVSGSMATLRQIVQELLDAYPDFQCVGDVAFWRDEIKTDRLVTEASLEELFSAERVEKAKALSRYEHNWQSAWLRTAAVVVPLCFAGVYYQDIQDAARRYFTDAEQRELQARWDDQVQRHNQQVVEAYNQIAANHPVDNWILRLAITIDQLRLEVRGWGLQSLSCGAQLPYCTAEWRNRGVGTFQGLERTMGHAGRLEFTSPLEATQSIEITNPSGTRFNPTIVATALDQIPTEREFKLHHISVLQAISSIPSVNAGVELERRQSVGGTLHVPDGVHHSEPILTGFSYGDWRLQGEGLRLLVGSMQKLDASVFFGASMKIEFRRDTDGGYVAKWEIKGNYIVKS